MELHELVERIERWKRRQGNYEDSEPVHQGFQAATHPHFHEAASYSHAHEPALGSDEVTSELDVESAEEAIGSNRSHESGWDHPPESSLASLPDEPDEDLGGLSLSDFEQEK
ncbi:MAG: hypothetical protein MUC50_03025 [Myxococcota bacterium]|jgi:hypothetical protein|nr:hypothetical protein [Myxococcota bacterium]